MQNYKIDDSLPPVNNFPNDNKLRVVWAYGAIYKNIGETRVPYIDIMLKEILENNTLSNTQEFIKISVAQLDIVRYMSIWFGNKRMNKFWNNFNATYIENSLFILNTNTANSISFKDKKIDSNYTYFPPFKYKFDRIDSLTDYWHFANSTFTKIDSLNSNVIVIIPSMEFLTSTYVPNEQKIRYQLLQYNIDDVLDNYIKTSNVENNKYCLNLYESKTNTNIAFLAYAKFNKTSRQRIQKLRQSLEVSSQYLERYPEVLPYQPTKLSLKGDGIWLDRETFFMFRVNEYSLPDDKEIMSTSVEIEVEKNKSGKEGKKYTKYPSELDNNDISITSERNPHGGNASQHITSEVSVLNSSTHKITHIIEKVNTLNVDDKIIDFENTEDINTISSGEDSYSESLLNVGKINIDEKSTLKQSKVLKMVIKSLFEIKKNKIDLSKDENIFVEEIFFIDENCEEKSNLAETQFAKILKKYSKKVTSWVYKKEIQKKKTIFLGFRNYLLLKVLLNNGTYIYLLEIDRKNDKESFLGLIFNLDLENNKSTLINLLFDIMENNGVLKNVILEGKKLPFKHAIKDDSMHATIENILKKAYKNSLFN